MPYDNTGPTITGQVDALLLKSHNTVNRSFSKVFDTPTAKKFQIFYFTLEIDLFLHYNRGKRIEVINMSIVDKIRELCAERGESLASLERKLGLGNGTIGRWENGSPTLEKLGRVADYFGVSVDYLASRDDRKTLDSLYLSCLRKAQKNNIDPADIELALNTIIALRQKDRKEHE